MRSQKNPGGVTIIRPVNMLHINTYHVYYHDYHYYLYHELWLLVLSSSFFGCVFKCQRVVGSRLKSQTTTWAVFPAEICPDKQHITHAGGSNSKQKQEQPGAPLVSGVTHSLWQTCTLARIGTLFLCVFEPKPVPCRGKLPKNHEPSAKDQGTAPNQGIRAQPSACEVHRSLMPAREKETS